MPLRLPCLQTLLQIKSVFGKRLGALCFTVCSSVLAKSLSQGSESGGGDIGKFLSDTLLCKRNIWWKGWQQPEVLSAWNHLLMDRHKGGQGLSSQLTLPKPLLDKWGLEGRRECPLNRTYPGLISEQKLLSLQGEPPTGSPTRKLSEPLKFLLRFPFMSMTDWINALVITLIELNLQPLSPPLEAGGSGCLSSNLLFTWLVFWQ